MPTSSEGLAVGRRWTSPSFPRRVREYGIAVLLIAASLGVRSFVQGSLGGTVSYPQFFPAILIAAGYGGFGPGALATALAVLSAMAFFLPPAGLGVGNASDLVDLGLFAGTGLGIAWVNHRWRAAAAAAVAQARRLDAILASAMDAVITIDAGHRVVLFSPAAEQLFGCSAADAIGQPIDRFIPERFRAAHRDHITRFGETRATARRMGQLGEVVGLRANGEEFPIEASISHVQVQESYYTVIIRDITDRKRAESALRASERQYRALFADSRVAMAVQTLPELAIMEVNDAFLRLFELTRGEIIGKTSADLGISEAAALGDVRARFGREGFVHDFECTRRTRSGDEQNILLDMIPVDIGSTPHVLTTFRDVTAQRRAEHKLVEQASLARLGEMVTAIAHEVRNPLAGVRTTLQIVGRRLPEDSAERAAARQAITHVDALKDLVQDMLAFARPRRPRVDLLEIRPLLERTVEFARADPVAANVAVSLEGDAPPIGGDAHQLSRVFLNLLRNAAQAMDGRGRVDIRIRAAEGRCVVTVRDSGPGIPPEVRTRLFQPFFTTKPSGTGLGLATAKQTLELHGGSIAADSEPGRGTTFTVTLPTWRSTDGAHEPLPATRTSTAARYRKAGTDRPGDGDRTSPFGSAPDRG